VGPRKSAWGNPPGEDCIRCRVVVSKSWLNFVDF
jgi:hypothetical protein